MDRVLKGLQGKTHTKKSIFDFLADINLEDLCKTTNDTILPVTESTIRVSEDNPLVVEKPLNLEETQLKEDSSQDENEPVVELKCDACAKTFTANSSLKRHFIRSPVCIKWNALPEEDKNIKLTKGLHLVLNDVLDRAVSDENLECKFCKTKFTMKGNLHKHFNSATVCNRLAYLEFKKLFNDLHNLTV